MLTNEQLLELRWESIKAFESGMESEMIATEETFTEVVQSHIEANETIKALNKTLDIVKKMRR